MGQVHDIRDYRGPEADSGSFLDALRRPVTESEAASKAWENRPSVVLGEIGLTLAATAAFVTAVCLVLTYLHIS